MGGGVAHLSFDRYKIAHTCWGRSCILCFETVLGMNKITPTTSPPPFYHQKFKNLQKKLFYFNDILRNLFKEVRFATLSFNRCNMAQSSLGRSRFKSLSIIKELPLPLL